MPKPKCFCLSLKQHAKSCLKGKVVFEPDLGVYRRVFLVRHTRVPASRGLRSDGAVPGSSTPPKHHPRCKGSTEGPGEARTARAGTGRRTRVCHRRSRPQRRSSPFGRGICTEAYSAADGPLRFTPNPPGSVALSAPAAALALGTPPSTRCCRRGGARPARGSLTSR